MSDKELQDKMAAIGVRYLARTEGEAQDLLRLVEQLPVGGATTMKEIELLAHRIRGSGAVFGIPGAGVAWRARKVEGFGVRRKAGNIVLPGSCTRAIDAVPGSNFVADFTGLGSVRLSFD